MSLLIFAEAPSPRLSYIADLLLRQLSGIPCSVTNDWASFEAYEGPRLNYSVRPIAGKALWIAPHGLLSQTGIHEQNSRFYSLETSPFLFPVTVKKADFPFDVFSAAFFLVSRYEEYLPVARDVHDRFPATASVAFQHGFLQRPVVNEWAAQLAKALQRLYPALQSKPLLYRFQPTYDIDIAWAYGHRPWWQTLGSTGIDVARGKGALLRNRLQVARKQIPDPYFTFPFLEALHQRHTLQPLFFFLLGNYGPFDRNISHRQPALRQLIAQLAAKYPGGIHPSYAASTNPGLLEAEIERLAQITGQPVVRSRQHYLRLRFPDTFRQLLKAGIKEDHTLGYADQPGFRAGIAAPFYWYDLEHEVVTDLLLHPFAVMEVTLQQYLRLSPEQGVAIVLQLSEAVRATGGDFTMLWHNSSFSPLHGWTGWQAAYEQMIEKVK